MQTLDFHHFMSNFLGILERHMFYLLNSLNIVRLLTEQTRAAQLPLSSQSESMYYAKKMDFWLINLIVTTTKVADKRQILRVS